MRIYVAGPMTGYPQFNYPLFDEVAATIREMGHEAITPSELDTPEVRAAALDSPDGVLVGGRHAGLTWGDFLSRDVKVVADEVDGIVVLPGWRRSKAL